MSNMVVDTLTVTQQLIVRAGMQAIARAGITQDNATIPIAWTDWRETGAYATTLPGTATSSILGLVGGTFGTAPPMLQTTDFHSTTTTAYARAMVRVPYNFYAQSGTVFQIAINGGMVNHVADTSCTVAVAAYRLDGAGSIGSQLCPTGAQSINSLTNATKTFTITPATLNPGDVLDIQITVAGIDGANSVQVTGAITAVNVICTVQG